MGIKADFELLISAHPECSHLVPLFDSLKKNKFYFSGSQENRRLVDRIDESISSSLWRNIRTSYGFRGTR